MRAWLVTLHMSLFNLLQKLSSLGITICFIRNVPFMGFVEGHIENNLRSFKLTNDPREGMCVCVCVRARARVYGGVCEMGVVAISLNPEPERFL